MGVSTVCHRAPNPKDTNGRALCMLVRRPRRRLSRQYGAVPAVDTERMRPYGHRAACNRYPILIGTVALVAGLPVLLGSCRSCAQRSEARSRRSASLGGQAKSAPEVVEGFRSVHGGATLAAVFEASVPEAGAESAFAVAELLAVDRHHASS